VSVKSAMPFAFQLSAAACGLILCKSLLGKTLVVRDGAGDCRRCLRLRGGAVGAAPLASGGVAELIRPSVITFAFLCHGPQIHRFQLRRNDA
jgi:hypothetical protein